MKIRIQCSRKTENKNRISNSVFPRRRKTVGTKVHALFTLQVKIENSLKIV